MLWLTFLKAFVVGGAICLIGQIIINWTHLTNGKILVIFLLAGAVLQGFGVYEYLIKWAGAGASVPISGFGYALVKGAVEAAKPTAWWALLPADLPPAQPECPLRFSSVISSR